MAKFAQIIVDIAIADVDRVYDYIIPKKIKTDLCLGQVVSVPFGHRMVKGFVIGFSDVSEMEENKLKEISNIVTREALFDENMLKLLKWMAAYYKTYLIKAIKTVIPTGLVGGNVSKKKIKYVTLSQDTDKTRELIQELKKRAPKQTRILEILLNQGRSYTRKQLRNEADTTQQTISTLHKKGYIEYIEKVTERRPLKNQEKRDTGFFKPTSAQQKAINTILRYLKQKEQKIFLLHGVTGSGKTEVYLQVIKSVLDLKQGAIVLVPEISLTPVMVRRFYSRYGDQIAILHSNLSLGERYDEWRRINRGEARVVVGARSAIFAPVKELGLIILDEEHETSYKQGENPFYHAREVALKRAKILGIPVVLGSATPSVETFYRAKKGTFNYLDLPQRIHQEELPPVKIVDMREELKQGNTSILSRDLNTAVSEALANKEQALIFLNRRGYANFVLCRECGHVIKCQNCDISLTYHASDNKLRCHYCDYQQKIPDTCPECGSRYIKEFGIGTERIEEELKRLFPESSIDRMDNDTTTRKGSHQKILHRLENGETDILVGTQMIAKGHDYPNIAVVGVITADTILNLPDFRSSERTFQLLTQVAGRTGRGNKAGQAFIQTYTPEHFSIQAASKHDYQSFFKQEILLREKLSYPPFFQLANLIIKGYNEEIVIETAQNIGIFLKQYHKYIHEILGPAPAPINKIRNRFRWQIILKFTDWKSRNHVLTNLINSFKNRPKFNQDILINIDVDPLTML